MKEQKENMESEILDDISDNESSFSIDSVVKKFSHSYSKENLLTMEEQYELIRKYQESKDQEEKIKVLEILYERNQGLIAKVVQRSSYRGVPFEDLFQEGYLGFQTAIEKFDLNSGNKLSTYATYWIRQAVNRAIEDNGKTIRIPVHIHGKINNVKSTEQKLEQKLGREPSVEEIAKEMKLSPGTVKDLLDYSANPMSLNALIGDGDTTELQDLLPSNSYNKLKSKILQDELRDKLIDYLSKFCNTDRELDIMIKRFGFDGKKRKTLDELGEEYSVTREWIRQLQIAVLKKLAASPKVIKSLMDYKPYIGSLNVEEEENYTNPKIQEIINQSTIKPEVETTHNNQYKKEEEEMKTLQQLLHCTTKELTLIKNSLTEEELTLLRKSFGKKLKDYQNNEKISLHEKEVLYKTILPRLEQKILKNREKGPIQALENTMDEKMVEKENKEMNQENKQDKKYASDNDTKKIKDIDKNTVLKQETNNIKEVNTQNKEILLEKKDRNYRVKDHSQYNKTPRNKNKYNNKNMKENNKQYKKNDEFNDLVSCLSKEILTDVINDLPNKEKVIGLLTYGYVDDKTYTTASIACLFNEPREEIEKTQEMIIDKYVESLTDLTDSIISEEPNKSEYKVLKLSDNK